MKRDVPAKLDIAMLEGLEPGALARCGLPVIRSEKARAFLAATLVSWVVEQGMGCLFIEKGKSAVDPLRGALQRHRYEERR